MKEIYKDQNEAFCFIYHTHRDLQYMRSFTFFYRANDAPYGRFNISEPSIIVDQTGFPEITRTFAYTIIRENGRIGDVMLNVLTTYTTVSNTESLSKTASLSMFQDPTVEYVEEFSTVFEDGRNQLRLELPVSPDAYIAPGSVFTISITDATLQDLEGLLSMSVCCMNN